MGARTIVLLLGVASVATPVVAQMTSSLAIVPVIAKVRGDAQTDWLTDLVISNVSGFAVDVEGWFFEENRNNLPLFLPVEELSLGVGETVTVHDAMTSWFPNKGDTKGFLLILAEPAGGGEESAAIAVTARIFNNADPGATYGQAVASGLLHIGVGAATSVLPGAQWDDLRRSNVGIVNLSTDPLDVIVTIYGADGSVVASSTQQVKSLSLLQKSLQQLGVSELGTPGRVEVRIDPGSITWDPCDVDLEDIGLGSLKGLFIAYLSRIDQVTGDAEFILSSNDWREYVDECGELPLAGF
jgi:hypothetical protein